MKEDGINLPLIWIDLEMTGLDPEKDRILEVAVMLTDNQLNIIENGPNLVIHQPDSILNSMDEWNIKQHSASGLIKDSQNSSIAIEEADRKIEDFLKRHCKKNKSPICGNSVWQDKYFLKRYMPRINNFINYRIIDVSSIKEVIYRWYKIEPNMIFKKRERHRAMDDVNESIKELKYYKKYFFKREGFK